MCHLFHRAVVVFLLISLTTVPTLAMAQTDPFERNSDVSAGAVAFDVVAVRPAGLVATAVGSVLFVLALPFSWINGQVGMTHEKLIKNPAMYTFTRPLGKL